MSAFEWQSATRKISAVLSTDYCPGFNRWLYWLKDPFWLLLLAIGGSALCGAFLNPLIFGLTAFLVLMVAVGMGLPLLAIRWVSCDVMFDVNRVRFGEPALVRLCIRNRSFFPVWGLSCIDGFTKSGGTNAATDSHDGLAFGRIRGRSVIEYSWPFVGSQRGRYPINEIIKVETSFPFGLYRAQKSADVVGRLIVWPETVKLAGLPDSIECESADDQFSDRRVGEFGDMLGTRLFRQGDSLRRVHWAQTARQQSLIVTERQAPVTTKARVVLDLAAPSHPPGDRFQSVEQCVRVAASVCESLHHQQCQIELQIGDELIVGGQNNGALDRIMAALATADVFEVSQKHSQYADDLLRRVPGFQLTITTSSGSQSHQGHQLVVTSNSEDERKASNSWLTISSHSPLSDLVQLWKEAV